VVRQSIRRHHICRQPDYSALVNDLCPLTGLETYPQRTGSQPKRNLRSYERTTLFSRQLPNEQPRQSQQCRGKSKRSRIDESYYFVFLLLMHLQAIRSGKGWFRHFEISHLLRRVRVLWVTGTNRIECECERSGLDIHCVRLWLFSYFLVLGCFSVCESFFFCLHAWTHGVVNGRVQAWHGHGKKGKSCE
jgi:hypothetical protein